MRTAMPAVLAAVAVLLARRVRRAPRCGCPGWSTWRPVMVDMAPQQGASGITLRNPDAMPVYGQVRVYAWEQRDGDDVLLPTDEIQVSPPIIQVPPRSEQLVRLVRASREPAAIEKSYRLVIDEIRIRPRRRGLRRARRAEGGAPEVCSLWRYALPHTRATRLEHRAGPVLRGGAGGPARSTGVVRRYRRARRIPGSEHQRRQYLATAVPRCAGPLVGQRGCAASASTCRRRRWQSGVAAGCDSGLALTATPRPVNLVVPDALRTPQSTRHARRPQAPPATSGAGWC